VKKYLLFISIVFYFLPAIAGNNYSGASKSVVSSVSTINLYTDVAASYPHTELEVNNHTGWVYSVLRHQNQQIFSAAGGSLANAFHNKTLLKNETSSNISFKLYLVHIYPSHNFW
jgi:membrane-bound acyltransferase YfiQ involved in biofilm formation